MSFVRGGDRRGVEVTERKKIEKAPQKSEPQYPARKTEAGGQLAGDVTHDFNNILAAIMGYAQLVLMKMKPDDPLRRDVERLAEAAQRAVSLAQSLPAYSRKQAETPAPGERKAAEPAVTGGTETVLVAEDDEASRRLEATVLKHFGYTVIEAVDGEDAVRKFVEYKDVLQAVVLDVIMPKKNGAEVYREIKAIRPDVKVIFSSGYTEDILEREGILAEGAVLLLKPVMPKELVRKVREALDQQENNDCGDRG